MLVARDALFFEGMIVPSGGGCTALVTREELGLSSEFIAEVIAVTSWLFERDLWRVWGSPIAFFGSDDF